MATLMRAFERTFRLGVVLVALLTVVGCRNPFDPANPEPPAAGGVREDFSSPAAVLNTIASALADKGPSGAVAYANAFADSTQPADRAFAAFHGPAAIDAWRAVSRRDPPEIWNLTLERAFYEYMVSYRPTAGYQMLWERDPTSESDDIEVTATGFAVIHRRYRLFATVNDVDLSVIAVGYADLFLYKANGRWFIYRWQDRVDLDIGANPVDTEQLSMGARRLEST